MELPLSDDAKAYLERRDAILAGLVQTSRRQSRPQRDKYGESDSEDEWVFNRTCEMNLFFSSNNPFP